ncbi:secretion protein HlyD [Tardibacter chloracetimidivorans]|uniref:Secretion protein HlyD n=1 Tax=Tardibacter chloracetimidivorans TaxID=1921510 RepID=A0A1L3ZW63_9SPHN|nr:HlyD family secretion protein [Tardibacter chloracetimidivorans]API59871.1 secretion protein HlyD [Tardibacter chloracetimidivorans]
MADADPVIRPKGGETRDGAAPAAGQESRPDAKKTWRRWALMLLVPLILLGAGGYMWIGSGRSASTDNAYVRADKVSVSSEVGGRIVAVYVKENQQVKAGDLLYRIDAEPYEIAIAQANAQIAQAQVDIATLRQTYAANTSSIAAARDVVTYAQQTYNRNLALMERGFNTRAKMDEAHHQLVQAEEDLRNAEAEAAEDRARLQSGTTTAGVNPVIAAAIAARDQAELNLARTEVRAPVDGIVTQASRLQLGQMAIEGLPALTIVASKRVWVEANFKETELAKMLPGQRAEIRIDAYPDLKLKGHVESLGAGTGSEFAILPAQNANGNWVKVTQRVPVRIAIDERSPRPLLAGLSATITVFTDDRNAPDRDPKG